MSKLIYAHLPSSYNYLTPDTSEIRLLPEMTGGGLAHCLLPPGKTSRAVRHKTVEEIWYVLEGEGEIWRATETVEQIDPLIKDCAVTIPASTRFQFRTTGHKPLKILIVTMPPWPGAEEAEAVQGKLSCPPQGARYSGAR